MRKVLVTGGAGYIGSHVVKQLGQAGYEVVIVDNLTTGREKSVLNGRLIKADIGDVAAMDKILSEHSFLACLHFAGSISVTESVSNPLKYYENNVVNSLKLLNLCKKYGINKFIFSSTAAVYGNPENGICTEETTISPINPYGHTKVQTEQMINDLASSDNNFKFVILRYFNVAGASIDGKIGQAGPVATHLIKIASQVVAGMRDKIEVFGNDYETRDGTCIRDYIHIEDLADAHVESLKYLEQGNESVTVNCGYGEGFSVEEVLKEMRIATNHPIPSVISNRRAGDAAILIAKAQKIKDTIGWTPKHNNLALICKTASEWEKKLLKDGY